MRTIVLNPTALGNVLTEEEIESLASGVAMLKYVCFSPRRDKELYSLKLNNQQRQEFENTKRRGWFYGTDKFGASRVADLSRRWLESRRLPIARVEKKTKYAAIYMDLLPIPKAEKVAWDAFCRSGNKWVWSHPPAEIGGKTTYVGSYNVVERVLKARGEACVEWLLDRFRACKPAWAGKPA